MRAPGVSQPIGVAEYRFTEPYLGSWKRVLPSRSSCNASWTISHSGTDHKM